MNGGVFLAWAGSRNYQKPVTVQHLSSDGSLSMAANGVSLDTANSYGTSLLISPDNSVVLAWDVEYGVRANVVNSSGDLLWDETMVIPSTNKYPRVALTPLVMTILRSALSMEKVCIAAFQFIRSSFVGRAGLCDKRGRRRKSHEIEAYVRQFNPGIRL
ncbi:MAG: hypothetical protein WCY21_05385 [Candidatus Cloacimonadaceae bacterium]|nr:hypothetical protein [Candidatus Cloacimonadota bacterium]MDX9950435.1 hypothetical protein [Candidatus Syntrophosphaera sp.]